MSAEIAAEGDDKQNVLTTNFDTCTCSPISLLSTSIAMLTKGSRYVDPPTWRDPQHGTSLEESV
jgi:hypothetical protein